MRWPVFMCGRWGIGLLLLSTTILIVQSQGPSPAKGADQSVFDSETKRFFWDFDQFPETPTRWSGREYYNTDWDITIHSRYIDSEQPALADLPELQGQHGSGCEAPPETVADHEAGIPANGTHLVNQIEQTVYVCRGHLMTAIASGYALIYLTPPYQVDWSEGEAIIRFRVSTARLSGRDFIDVWVSPFEEHLQLAFDDLEVDLSGPPRRGLNFRADFNEDTPWLLTKNLDFETIEFHKSWEQPTVRNILAASGVEESFRRRDLFEIRISNTRAQLLMPEYNGVLIDETFDPPLDWSKGVVQFGHHAYNPEKDGAPNTWHWDEFEIVPAEPFTIILADKRSTGPFDDGIITFERPAPANAYLRFAGISTGIRASFDGGNSWQTAEIQPASRAPVDEHYNSFWMPIPEGVQTVHIAGEYWWGGVWHARDFSIWSQSGVTIPIIGDDLDLQTFIPLAAIDQ